MALEYPDIVFYPANMRRWSNAGILLAHPLRSWPNSKPALSQRFMFAGYVQYLLHNSAMPYIEAWVAIYQAENWFIGISNMHAQLFSQSLKCYEQLHFSDPVVEISDRHVFPGKTNTAIHGPHINGMGSSMTIIILTIMWKITT